MQYGAVSKFFDAVTDTLLGSDAPAHTKGDIATKALRAKVSTQKRKASAVAQVQKKTKPQTHSRMPEWLVRLSAYFGKADKEYLIENLGLLINAGTPASDALNAITKGVRTAGVRELLLRANESIANGHTLAHALGRHHLVAKHTANVIAVAEQSGRLAQTLDMLAEQEEKDRMLRVKIKTAMTYPLLVLSLTVLIGVGIAWFILPRLAVVFSQLQVELPAITKGLIAAGEFMSAHGAIVAPGVIALLGIVVFFLFFYHRTRHIGITMLFYMPGIRRLLQEIELSRMGYLMGNLLRSGLSVVRSLDALQAVVTVPAYTRLYVFMRERIIEGYSFAESFAAYKKTNALLPGPVQQLIIASERSGSLSDTFVRIGEHYEERSDASAKSLSVLLEPVLLVVVWGGVVAVAFAVMLPIYSLVGNLNVEEEAGNAPKSTAPAVILSQEGAEALAAETATVQTPEEVLPTISLDPNEEGVLNVRSEPEDDAGIFTQVSFGETYAYEDRQEGWYEIVLANGDTGWIVDTYVVFDSYVQNEE